MDRTKAKWSAGVILAVAGMAAYAIRSTGAGERGDLGLVSAAIAVPDPVYEDEPLDDDFREALRAREVLYRMYANESESPVWVFLAYFDQQREGSQVHSPRHCYPGSGWSIEREVDFPASWRPGRVQALVVNDGSARRLVCYWYQTPGAITGDVFRLKLILTRRAVLRRSQDVVYGNVSTPVGGTIEDAFERMAPYVQGAEQKVLQLYQEKDERRADTH